MLGRNYINRIGIFRAKVKAPSNGWFGEAGERATPFIRIPLVVCDGSDQDGNEIVWRGWLTEKAEDNTLSTLAKAFPLWDGDIAKLVSGESTPEGVEVQITTDSEEYNGQSRIVAKWMNPIGGGGGKKIEPDNLKSLVARLSSKGKAIAKQVRVESGANVAAPAASNLADDDLPY